MSAMNLCGPCICLPHTLEGASFILNFVQVECGVCLFPTCNITRQ